MSVIKFTKSNDPRLDYYAEWTGTVDVPQLREDGSLLINDGYEKWIKPVLDQAYPLPVGLVWGTLGMGYNQVFFRPEPVEKENPFRLMEQGRENEIWLKPIENQPIRVGEKVRARERGGFTTVTVEEILQFRRFVWVRGRWSDGLYLEVEKFLAGMPTISDIAHHRKQGEMGWQGSAV